MTETSSSSSFRKVSAIVASSCSTSSRSTIGTIRARFGPTRLRASKTKLRTVQAWAGADEVERRARGAGVVARRRAKSASLNRGDLHRQLCLECRDVLDAERRAHRLVRALEELVDDLDLGGACSQDRERVHQSLEPVLALDDLGGRGVLEHIRL